MVFQSWDELIAANPSIGEKYDKQEQTDNLSKKRTGIFTASEVWQLLTSTMRPAENDTQRGYIQRKAIESITGERFDPPFSARATEHGKEFEPEAVKWFEENWKVKTEMTGDDQEFFKCKGLDLGATPDGFTNVKGEKILLEIKCPYNVLIHLQNIENAENIAWFKKERMKYFVQIQTALFATNLKTAFFISFGAHQRLKTESKMVVSKITRDDNFIDNVLVPVVKNAVFERERERERYEAHFSKMLLSAA